MNYSVFVRQSAELDILDAQQWYEQQQVGLATKFYHELDVFFERLSETPLLYPIVYRNIRRAVLHQFPFLIWFRVDGSQVIVLACTHSRSNPRRIRQRLR